MIYVYGMFSSARCVYDKEEIAFLYRPVVMAFVLRS